MRNVLAIARREFAGYFATPLALVFLVIFVGLTGAFAFYVGGFFENGQATLEPFFLYHPWLYLVLVPAVAMRLWAEELKTGSIELLMTLPTSTVAAVLGKFLAAWAFTALALALTFPLWITVNVLGDPDNGVILASYLGSLLMAGAFLAIGSCLSALTRNQVIAFVGAATVCFLFVMSGLQMVLDVFRALAPPAVVEAVASMSFLTHYQLVMRGVIEAADVTFFLSLIVFWLLATVVALDMRKAG